MTTIDVTIDVGTTAIKGEWKYKVDILTKRGKWDLTARHQAKLNACGD